MRHEKLAVRITSPPYSSLGISLLAACLLGPLCAQDAAQLEIRLLSIGSLEQNVNVESQPIKIVIEDSQGHPVANAAVAFRLPEEGATGSFSNGLRTDVVLTSADGTAQAGPIQWGPQPGSVALRISAIKAGARGSATFGVDVASASGGPRRQEAALRSAPDPPAAARAPALRRIEEELEIPRYQAAPLWKRKWVVVALAAGGALAGGYAARTFQRTSPVIGAQTGPPGQIDLGPVVIGPPLVTVGRP
jgi:hypothetical protein